MVDQRAPVMGRGVRPPCSDSEDDVLSVGPMRPLVAASPLGGARRHDDDMLPATSLREEWLVDSWTAGDRYGTRCARLDNFDWVMPAGYPVGVLPRPEEDDSLSDIEPDVCDVPDVPPVCMETAAGESLCFHVVARTRPQGGRDDPVLSLPMCRGQDFLTMEDPEVIVSGRESIITESAGSCEICVDQLPIVVPKLAAVPLAVSVVVQTRPRVGWSPDLPLPVDEGRECLQKDGLDVILSARESTVRMSKVSSGICVEPDLLPVVMSTDVMEPLAVPVVALTRSLVGGPEDGLDVMDVKCQSWHLCRARPTSSYVVHGCRGAAGCTCGRSDEITGWWASSCCPACEC